MVEFLTSLNYLILASKNNSFSKKSRFYYIFSSQLLTISVNNNNFDLTRLLAFLFINKTNNGLVIKIVTEKTNYVLFLDKHLLNKKMYFSVISVFKKWHQMF